MAKPALNNRSFLSWILIFFSIWFLVNLLMPKNKEAEVKDEQPQETVITLSKDPYKIGDKVELFIDNKKESPVWIASECPGEPFEVSKKEGEVWQQITAVTEEECPGADQPIEIASMTKGAIDYGYWNQQLFLEPGTYRIAGILYLTENAWKEQAEALADVPETDGASDVPAEESLAEPEENNGIIGPELPAENQSTQEFSVEFTIKEKSTFSKVTTVTFYQPIYNFLIFLVKSIPGHSLGLAIIILTLIIRAILFVPTYKSLKAQKSMQEIQPKLKALKEKYKDNQQKQGEEMMKLYKEHGVNPCGSCLPILVQMPFLIAIFYVLRGGLDPSHMYLLYEPLKSFDFHLINHWFLSFDLTAVEAIIPEQCVKMLCVNGVNLKSLIMPVLIGGLQFFSMWLSTARNKKKVKDITPNQKNEPKQMMEAEMAGKMMMYVMPFMIAWFAFSYPVGLSLYWAVTTLFSIGQQVILNRKRESLNQEPKHA